MTCIKLLVSEFASGGTQLKTVVFLPNMIQVETAKLLVMSYVFWLTGILFPSHEEPRIAY